MRQIIILEVVQTQTDAKPSAMKLASTIVQSSAEAKLALTMPSRDRGRRSQRGKDAKRLNHSCLYEKLLMVFVRPSRASTGNLSMPKAALIFAFDET